MTKKVALFAFNGEPMCFMHVLLNTLDMHERGYDLKLVIEGAATKMVETLEGPGEPMAALYQQVKDAGLIDCVCKACATKTGALDSAKSQELELCDELKGHPSVARYMEEGFEVIVF